ncbi:hypothetical protein E4T48_06132 [Aureobasidium sp. EXF-10727]|nr:hypothetical protein E4T48_06132 [Aureobasidium sp. EXF-10727]
MSGVSPWIGNARGQRHSTDDDDHQEDMRAIDVVESLLKNQRSASATARVIADTYEPRLKSGLRTSALAFWAIISEATRAIEQPGSDRLADLIIEIHKLPDLLDGKGNPIRWNGQTYWRDLPGWGRLLYATTFGAVLFARAEFETFMPFHASIAMEIGIERPYDEKRELSNEWRMCLPPAATWILIAGDKLYKLCHGTLPCASANEHSAPR